MQTLELFLSGLTAATLLLAIAKAKAPTTLRIYLAIQLGTFLANTGVGMHFGRQSDPYRVAYSISTLAVTYASWRVVRDAGADILCIILSTLSAILAGTITMSALQHYTYDNFILLLSGTLTVFFATAMILRCRFSKYRSYYIPLAVLWATLGPALLGFSIEAHRWDSLSYWLTYTLGILAFGWIGWTGWRRQRMIQHKEHDYGLQQQPSGTTPGQVLSIGDFRRTSHRRHAHSLRG